MTITPEQAAEWARKHNAQVEAERGSAEGPPAEQVAAVLNNDQGGTFFCGTDEPPSTRELVVDTREQAITASKGSPTPTK